MPRTRPDNTDRDRLIVAKHVLGQSFESIAAEFGLTRQRVSQIVKAATPRAPGEAERAALAAELRRKYEQLERICQSPPLKVSAMARPTEDPRHPGTYVVDESVTIRAIAEQNKISDRYRQLFGVDIRTDPAPLFDAEQIRQMAEIKAAQTRMVAAGTAPSALPRPSWTAQQDNTGAWVIVDQPPAA